MKKTIILGLLLFIAATMTTAQMLTSDSIEMKEADKEILLSVGDGIGEVNRTIYHYNASTNVTNITYKMYYPEITKKSCTEDICQFNIYQRRGINKDFEVELHKICTKYEIDKDLGEICVEWRNQTADEIFTNAEIKVKKILEDIVLVTIARQGRKNNTPETRTLKINTEK